MRPAIACCLLLASGLAAPDAGAQAAAPGEDEIIVTGSRYRGDVASGGARIDADVRELPLSISVVSDELIEDRALRNLRDLADNVAGVEARIGGPGAFSNDFVLRGFSAFSAGSAINGFRADAFIAAREPQHMERVEFLKGPASVLYGATGALGGLVNYVTKTPQAGDFARIGVSAGAFGYGRATADLNASPADTLGLRLNAAVSFEQPLRATQGVDSQFVAPAVRWQPAPGLTLLAEGFWFHGDEPGRESNSLPSVPESLGIGRRFRVGEAVTRRTLENYGARFDLQLEVAEGMTLRQGLWWSRAESTGRDQFTDLFGELFASPTSFNRREEVTTDRSRDLSSQSELRWTFSLGPTRQKLLIGYEYAENRFGPYEFFEGALAPIDFVNPVYGALTGPLAFSFEGQSGARAHALYAQNFVELGQFRLLAGLRYDDVESTSRFCFDFEGCQLSDDPLVSGFSEAPESALSPRLGLAWLPAKDTVLYASWSRSFNPNPFPDRNGDTLPAERGEQVEGGIRQEFADGRFIATLALFSLTRRNVPTEDPQDPFFQIAVGEQRARGIELEFAGRPTDWLELLGAYAHIDAEVTRDNLIPVGTRLSEAPRDSASLLARVDLAGLGLPGTSVSALGVWRGARETLARPEVLQIDESFRLDLALFQEISPRLRVQLNLDNVTDARIYEPSNQGIAEQLPRRLSVGAVASF